MLIQVFSSPQVSHEFAINFNPTNPFCSGEHLPALYVPSASSAFPLHFSGNVSQEFFKVCSETAFNGEAEQVIRVHSTESRENLGVCRRSQGKMQLDSDSVKIRLRSAV